MMKTFSTYQCCKTYLERMSRDIERKLRNRSIRASWSVYETLLQDVNDVISCMEENANEYIYTNCSSEYRSALTGYFGHEPIIEGDLVALTAAYKSLDDCEANKRDFIILAAEV